MIFTHNRIFSVIIAIFILSPFAEIWGKDGELVVEKEYFQQQVNYKIKVQLDTKEKLLLGEEALIYKNNSPDTLNNLYFHLYWNSFRAGSLKFPDAARDRGYVDIESLTDSAGNSMEYRVDDTILILPLKNPLYPGSETLFNFKFRSKIPPASSRFGYRGKHFDIGYWYPVPAVYDRKGWHLNQHLDSEYYQEFGEFYVEITLPADYVVGATGDLLNAEEVLPDTSSEEAAKSAIPVRPAEKEQEIETKTWKFRAVNVHDFAWTADPGYIRKTGEWNGITVNVLILPHRKKQWENVLNWGLKTVKYFSRTFGEYPYNQITIADTYIRAGGIEYPQIVMINDYISESRRYLPLVIIHELGHNWFFGLLGSNQTEEGWMDEGFTSFIEIKGMEHIFGRSGNLTEHNSWFEKKFKYIDDDRSKNYRNYLLMAKYGFEEKVRTRPDLFKQGGAIASYDKPAVILFMLEYVLGEDVFYGAMREYFNRWMYRHPYPEDFFEVMERVSGRDLSWFFDEWLNTTWTCDYAVGDVRGHWEVKGERRVYSAAIELIRKGRIVMPIDIEITLKNGEKRMVLIPVDYNSKEVEGAIVLPYWHFSRSKYIAEIELSQEIKKVEIDPSGRLADVYRLDNVSGFLPPVDIYFIRNQMPAPPLNSYLFQIRPDIFYNDVDGLEMGFTGKGNYLYLDHRINFKILYGLKNSRTDFDFQYRDAVDFLGRLGRIQLRAYSMDGRQGGHLMLFKRMDKIFNRQPIRWIRFGIKSSKLVDSSYLPYEWDKGYNNTVNIEFSSYRYFRGYRKGLIFFNFQSSTLFSDHSYSKLDMDYYRRFDIEGDLKLHSRIYLGFSKGDVPVQSLYYLTGGNPDSQFFKSFYRSKGSFPDEWRRRGYIHPAGGGNLRGYLKGGASGVKMRGKKIAAFNLAVQFRNPLKAIRLNIPILSDFESYYFYDYGAVWDDDRFPDSGIFVYDMGLGFFLRSDFLNNYGVEGFRFEFPWWLNSPPIDEDNLKWRFVFGLDAVF